MKTQIITAFAALVLSAGITATTYAAPATKENNATVLNDIKNISEIEVRGNVELYISNGDTDQVKVYNKYYSENALVQGTNGLLRITSYQTEKLVVWVSARDIRRISAYDNTEVKSFGDLSGIEFSVDLHNNATAKLNVNAFALNISVDGDAKANLAGRADQYALKYNHLSNVSYNGFDAGRSTTVQTGIAAQVKTNRDELTDL
jgi:hypothetical protein